MRYIWAFIVKEFKQLRRDRRLVAFVSVMPILLFILFGLALKLEPENVRMAYVDMDKSFFSDAIKTNIWAEGYFQLYEVDNEQEIIDEIRRGNARAGLFIGPEFSAELTENNQPSVQMYVDGTMPSLTTAMDNNKGAITDDTVTNSMYFLDPDEEAVVIAPAERRVEEEMARLFEPDQGVLFGNPALDVGMAGLPVVGLDAEPLQFRIG